MPTSNGMRTHTGFSERTKWMFTDRGGRLDMEPVYIRNEINSLRKAESSFRSTVLMDSNYQSTFGTFSNVLSNHLPQRIAQRKTVGMFGSSKTTKTSKP